MNEQNEQAVGFHRHAPFEVVGRSPLDGGQPYPLLHMQLGVDADPLRELAPR